MKSQNDCLANHGMNNGIIGKSRQQKTQDARHGKRLTKTVRGLNPADGFGFGSETSSSLDSIPVQTADAA